MRLPEKMKSQISIFTAAPKEYIHAEKLIGSPFSIKVRSILNSDF
jgi:hypothetical protein